MSDPNLSEELVELCASVDRAREEAEGAQERFRSVQRYAAFRLAESGLYLREVGEVLGVSMQRAHQLVSEYRAEVDKQ